MEEKRENNEPVKMETDFCYHCGLSAKRIFTAKINSNLYSFCCNGCKTACELIYMSGAGSYYENRTSSSDAVNLEQKDYPYESELFKSQYLQEKDGLKTVTLYLENIHCASCIWVIEKVLGNLKGISNTSVNFTAQRANITFDDNIVSFQEIINTLVKVGYPPTPLENINLDNKLAERNKSLLLKMVIAFFATLSTMFLAEPFYLSYIKDLDNNSAVLLKYMSLIISTPVFFYCSSPFLKGMLTALKVKVFTMDSSIFIGAFLIYAYSTFTTITAKGNIYFDCLTMFLFFILLGRFIESNVQQKVFNKAGQEIKSYPKQATIVEDDNEKIVHIEEVKIGDTVLVKPGELIPVDGIVLFGKTHIDESLITGESKSVEKNAGDKVLGGSINQEGAIYFTATRIGVDTTIQQIKKLAEDVKINKTKLQYFADKFAHFFIISVLLIALITYLVNVFVNPEQAMLTAISIIIVTCPCALGLAMPSAISLATSIGVKKGILFKSSEVFEKLGGIDYIVLDKTGTVTTGKAKVTQIVSVSKLSEESILEITAAIERYSEHPVAWALVEEATKRKVNTRKAHSFVSYSGKGVTAVLDNQDYFIGSRLFIEEKGIDFQHINLDVSSESIVYIADNKNLLGYFVLKDDLKPNTIETIEQLKKKGIKFALVSGDKNSIVKKIAKQINVDDFASEVLPEGKVKFIANLKQKGYKVAMIGDGVNDAPAMASADLGIAINSKNNLAGITSDIIILNENFLSLSQAVKLSNRTYYLIKQNVFISLFYNILVIPFAALGYISPLAAAILMPLSSLLVLSNSLRITRGK